MKQDTTQTINELRARLHVMVDYFNTAAPLQWLAACAIYMADNEDIDRQLNTLKKALEE